MSVGMAVSGRYDEFGAFFCSIIILNFYFFSFILSPFFSIYPFSQLALDMAVWDSEVGL